MDLETARQLMAAANPLTVSVCFHCQQCAEKSFKAVIAAAELGIERTHDLERLRHVCAVRHASLAGLGLGDLTTYAVETRYPDDLYIPPVEEAREALCLAETVHLAVRRCLDMP